MNRIIALDFDGTLNMKHKFPLIGEPNWDVIYKAKECQENGDTVILWTCRTDEYLDQAIEWCKDHGLTFDHVMQDPPGSFNQSRKIYATIYVDDRAPGSIEYFVKEF